MSIFLIFTCILYGSLLFLNSSFYIPVFLEQQLFYFCLIFSQLRVCCSWENFLSAVYHLCFNQRPGIYRNFNGRHDIRIPFFICVLSLWAVFWYTHPRSLVESGGGEFYFFCFLFNLYITVPFDYDSHNQYKLPYICMLWLNCNAVHSSLSTTL